MRAAFWLGIVAVAVACAGCKPAAARDRAAPLRIGYFANLTHAQAVLGVASGELERALGPAKLETRVFNAGPSVIEALFAGEIDIGYVGAGPVISAHRRSRGQGLRVVAAGAANGVVVVARSGSGIRGFTDLVGKRIATPQLGNTQDISARHYLTHVLGQRDAKNVVPIENSQQAAMLARGDIDAAWVPEPWGQRLIAETGATLVGEERELWPSREFELTLVVTTPEFLARRPDAVESALAVHAAWTRRLTLAPHEHTAALADALFALTGTRLPQGVLDVAITRVTFTNEPRGDSLRTFGEWTHDLGFARAPVSVAGLVDTAILRKAVAR